jgi:hypothetical protein
MIPEFDQNGNLPAGFIMPTIGEFKERFVVELGGSGTRGGYLLYVSRLL